MRKLIGRATEPCANADAGTDKARRRGTFERFKNRLGSFAAIAGLAVLASCAPDEIRTPVNPDGGSDAADAQITQNDAGEDVKDANGSDANDASPDSKPKWDLDFLYCREIAITGQFPQGYSNKVRLTPLDFDYSHAKPDFSDRAFYEGTCEGRNIVIGELGSWNEKVNPSGETTVWVKTSNANAPVIAMYYGNSAASGTSDIQKAFLFGDDFGQPALDTTVRWDVTDPATVTITNNDLVFYAPVLNDRAVSSKQTFSAGKRLVASIKFEASSVSGEDVNYAGLGMGTGGDVSASPYLGKTMILSRYTSGADVTTALFVSDMAQGQAYQVIGKPAGWISDQTYDSYELVWKQNNEVTLTWGNQTATITTRVLASYTLPVRIGGVYYNYSQRGRQTVSWVGLSELADPEPAYAVGSEESR